MKTLVSWRGAAICASALLGASALTPALADGERIEDRMLELERLLKDQQEQLQVLRDEQARLQAAARAAEEAEKDAPKMVDEGGLEDADFRFGETEVSFSGYVKFDVIASSFSDGELPTTNIGRDFYIPSLIPVIGGSGGGFEEGNDYDLDFNFRETRFIAKTRTEFENGIVLGGHLEFDFQVTVDGDERVSNSSVPRIRNGFVTVEGLGPGKWLFGQTWSTFHDVSVLPDNVDFIGPTEGTVFNRQPMIRWSYKNFQVALEQPETAVTPFGGGGRDLPGDDLLPDFAARYTHRFDGGFVRLQGIARLLRAENVGSVIDETANEFGYGLSLSGKLNVFKRDDFRFMVTAGEGIGRYVGVNIINDVVDTGTGDIESRGLFSTFASYRHFWTDKLRSNLTLSYFRAADDTEFTGLGETRDSQSIRANIIYKPVSKLEFGLETSFGSRTIEGGESGDLFRTQFGIRYDF